MELVAEDELSEDTSPEDGSPEDEQPGDVSTPTRIANLSSECSGYLCGPGPISKAEGIDPGEHLSREKLLECLEINSDVFTLDSSELGTTTVVTHTIETGDSRHIRQGPTRLLYERKKWIKLWMICLLKE